MAKTEEYRTKLKALGYLDFEVLREDWGFYEIEDGSLLRVKLVLVNVFKKGEREYTFSWNNVIGVVSPPQLRGPPDTTKYKPDELLRSIVEEDLDFKILKEGLSEYLLEDNTRLIFRPILVEVSRTNKYDSGGMPIYLTNVQPVIKAKPKRKT